MSGTNQISGLLQDFATFALISCSAASLSFSAHQLATQRFISLCNALSARSKNPHARISNSNRL